MIRPSRPTLIRRGSSAGSPNRTGSGGVSTVTSTVTCDSSSSERSSKRGSWHAERAPLEMAPARDITGIGTPMHPLRSPEGYCDMVTKAPDGAENTGSEGGSGNPVPLTSASTVARA